MMLRATAIFLVLLFTTSISGKSITEDLLKNDFQRCSIFVSQHLGDPQPLLIRPGTNEFAMPLNGAGIVRVEHNEQLELFCTDGFRNPAVGTTVLATCINETRFHFNGMEFLFQNFACNELPRHDARQTSRTCAGGGSIAEIGFPVGNRWFNLIEVCHNAASASNTWVHFYQIPGNQGFQRSFPRIPFIQGNFFPGMNVNALYTIARQRRTIASLLGSDALADQLVHDSGDIFMARGHLAARADFVFGPHQQASFYFINAAPQWQSFNGGNWEHIEDGVRRFVNDRNIEVEIWTGTYGVITLPDINGNPVEIFLDDSNNNQNRRLPVPRIYYKLVIRPSTASGIVFVGVNNPHIDLAEIQRDYIFCDDVGHLVTYLPWNRFNITGGYSYACEVNQFANFVGHLPPLPHVNNLLL